jgi:thioesterase-3
LEEARWQLFEKVMQEPALEETTFYIRNININYLHPATLGDVLSVECGLKNIKNKSWILCQKVAIKGTGTLGAEADVTLVAIDKTSGKSTVIDDSLRSLIESIFV